MKIFLAALLFMISIKLSAQTADEAEVIEIPEEELATESVLPKFDYHQSVKDRYITFNKKIELGGFAGLALNEPFFNQTKIGLNASYHTSEFAAWNLMYSAYLSGITANAEALKEQDVDVTRAPNPKSILLANYEAKFLYGKLSLSKKTILHTSLYGDLGLGVVTYSTKSTPAVSLGIGQKFYFNNSWALRFDLRMLMNQGPSPTSSQKVRDTSSDEEFKDKMVFNTLLDLGFSYLF